jgi:hypothetical protein
MDYNKIQYFEKIESKEHREFVDAHNNCILCGSVLELQHVPVPAENAIKEEAHCPSCDMRTRAKVFASH